MRREQAHQEIYIFSMRSVEKTVTINECKIVAKAVKMGTKFYNKVWIKGLWYSIQFNLFTNKCTQVFTNLKQQLSSC